MVSKMVQSIIATNAASPVVKQPPLPVPDAPAFSVPESDPPASSQSAGGSGSGALSSSSAVYLHIMQEVAADPGFADYVAGQMSHATHYARLGNVMEAAVKAGQDADQKIIDGLQPQLTAIYESDKAAGKSGAETVADVLELQLAQPQSYWNAIDPDHLMSNDAKGLAQAELNTLQATSSGQ